MADDLLLGQVGLDVTNAFDALNKLNAQLRRFGLTMNDVVQQEVQFNAAGRATVITLQAITAEGDRVAVSANRLGGIWRGNAEAVRNYRTNLAGANQLQAQLRATLFNPGQVSTATPKELANFNTSNQQFAEFVARSGVSAQRALQIFNSVRAGTQENFRGVEISVAKAAQSVLNSFDKMGAAARKVDADLAKVPRQTQIFNNLSAVFRSNNIADPLQRTNFELSLQKLAKFATSVKATNAQIANAFTAVRNNSVAALQGVEADLARMIQRIEALNQRVNSTKATTAQQLEAELQRQFGRGATQQAGATVTEINRLQKAIASAVKLVGDGQGAVTLFRNTLATILANPSAQFQGDAGKMANAIRSIIAAQENLGANSRKISESILISWQSFVRLFTIQLAHVAVTNLIQSFKQAITTASEFQIRISELRTISQDNQRSFGEFSDELIRLSSAFGLPALDAAAGAYELLSNQVAKTTTEFQIFSREAAKFSIATVSTFKDSINLLTSAVTSFGIEDTRVNEVAATFFKTIEVGRVKANEMANTFGRMGPLARAAGISFEEVNAAIQVLTIRGTKFDDASTLINNLILQMLKPSEAMKELFLQWGVASGEAAFQTFGLAGVMDRFNIEAKKGATRLGELIPEMRGLKAVVGLTDTGFRDLTANLLKNEQATKNYEAAVAIGMESAGKKLQIEIGKIKNYFLTLGSTTLDIVQNISDATGVKLSDAIIKASSAVAQLGAAVAAFLTVGLLLNTALKSLRTGVIAYIFTMNAAQRSQAAMTASTVSFIGILSNPFTAALAVAGATVALIVTQAVKAERAIKEAQKSFRESIAESDTTLTERLTAENNKRVDNFTKALNAQFQAYKQYIASVQAANNKLIAELEEQNKEQVRVFTESFDAALDVLRDKITTVKKAIQDATEAIKEANKNIFDITKNFDEQQFTRSLDFSDSAGRIKLMTDRIAVLEKRLQEFGAQGDTANVRKTFEELDDIINKLGEDGKRKFQQNLTEIEQLNNQILAARKALGKDALRDDINQARGGRGALFTDIRIDVDETNRTLDIIAAQKKINDLEKENAKIQLDRQPLDQRRLDNYRKAVAYEQELAAAAEKAKKAQEAQLAALEESLRQAQNAVKEFAKFNTAFNKGDFKTPDDALAKFDSVAAKLKATIAPVNPQDQLNLELQLDQQRANLVQQIEAKARKEKLAAEERNADEIQEALVRKAQQAADAATKSRAEIIKQATDIGAALSEAEARVGFVFGLAGGIGGIGGSGKEFSEAIAKTKELLEIVKVTPTNDAFQNLIKQMQVVRGLSDQIIKDTKNDIGRDLFGGQAQKIQEFLLNINTASENLTKLGTNLGVLQNATKILSQSNKEVAAFTELLQQSIPAAFQATEAATTSFKDRATDSFNQLRNEVELSIQAVDTLRVELEKLKFNPVGPDGNPIPRFARGTGPRGTDTQLAWLTPGEGVLNARMTRKFYPQFMAMNAGIVPQYFSRGGVVQNVGDININVSGTTLNEQSARQFARSIRREMRRRGA